MKNQEKSKNSIESSSKKIEFLVHFDIRIISYLEKNRNIFKGIEKFIGNIDLKTNKE